MASLRLRFGRYALQGSRRTTPRGGRKSRQAEKVVVLLQQLDGPVVHRAQAVDEVALGVIGLARNAIKALVGPEGYPAIVVNGLHQLGNGPVVAGLGRADEVVVGDFEQFPGVPETSAVNVGLFLGVKPVGLCRTLDLEPVLVGPRQEEHVVAQQPVPAGQGVGRQVV